MTGYRNGFTRVTGKPFTQEDRDRIFRMLCDDLSEMSVKEIVRAYIWPDNDDTLYEQFGGYLEEEENPG